MDVYRMLTQTGTKSHPFPTLKQSETGTWYAGNQISSYELLVRLSRDCAPTNQDQWVKQLDQIIRTQTDKYGSYAELNQWSPEFTEAQLRAFASLCGTRTSADSVT